MKTVVIALGGNALLRKGEKAEAEVQQSHIAAAAEAIAEIAGAFNVVVTHGNGPQVGLLALQADAYKPVSPYPLDILGAESEGMIGYLIEQNLSSLMPNRQVATLLTLVEVDALDPAFNTPTKPIGPFYDKSAAKRLTEELGWSVAEIGDSIRRIVASPKPRAILEISTIRLLLEANVLIICAGGGGIPVILTGAGGIKGVEAVVDKDRTAALLANELAADQLLILTDVPAVYADWGKTGARTIRRATPDVLRQYTFAEGSMGPKVEAACEFVDSSGHPAAIGALEEGFAIVREEAGTRIVPGSGLIEWWD